jgi:hypothetical protein
MQHAFGTEVLVDVWPMHTVAISNEAPIRSLRWRGFGETPRPRQWHANHTTIDQVGGDRIVGHFDACNPGFNADRSAHTKPR